MKRPSVRFDPKIHGHPGTTTTTMHTDKTGLHKLRIGDLVRWDTDDMLYTIVRFLPGKGRNQTAGIVFEGVVRTDGCMPNGMQPDETNVTKIAN